MCIRDSHIALNQMYDPVISALEQIVLNVAKEVKQKDALDLGAQNVIGVIEEDDDDAGAAAPQHVSAYARGGGGAGSADGTAAQSHGPGGWSLGFERLRRR